MSGDMCGRGHAWQGVCMAGGVHGKGVCAWWGTCVAEACMAGGHAPPMDRMTDACKNITLPQTSLVGGNR